MNHPVEQGKQIVFEHLTRTGGLSLLDALYRHYSEERMYSIKKNEYNQIPSNAIISHGHRAGFWLKNPENYTYFTLLRDPENHLLSHFNSLSRQIKRKHFWRIRLQGKGIGYYLNELKFKSFDNLMVRRISGNYDVPFGCINQSHLEQAIQAIKRKYFFIGFTDEFELSLLELKKLLGWEAVEYPFYVRTNSEYKLLTVNRNSYLEDFRNLNKYDYMLYDYCKNMFKKERRTSSEELSDFKKKLAEFQLENPGKISAKTKIKMILMNHIIKPTFS